jgi:GTP cyclohydrolase FolE2
MALDEKISITDPGERLLDGKEDLHDAFHARKSAAILDACRRRDFAALQALAGSKDGFVTDALRQHACKLLSSLLGMQ